MKNKNQYLYKNLIVSIFMLILALAFLFCTIFAWFTLKDHANVGDFQVNVQSEYIVDVTIGTYAISAITEGEFQKEYQLAFSEGSLVSLEDLPIYDPLGITNNEYKTCLAINLNFLVTVDDVTLAIVAYGSSDFITSAPNWLSNCTQIVSAIYNNTTLSLSSDEVSKSFVSSGGSEPSKIKTLELFRDQYSAGNVSLWFVLEYNVEALNIIHYVNDGATTEKILYHNDIRLEIIDL